MSNAIRQILLSGEMANSEFFELPKPHPVLLCKTTAEEKYLLPDSSRAQAWPPFLSLLPRLSRLSSSPPVENPLVFPSPVVPPPPPAQAIALEQMFAIDEKRERATKTMMTFYAIFHSTWDAHSRWLLSAIKHF